MRKTMALGLVVFGACTSDNPTAPQGKVLASNACAHNQVAVNSAFIAWFDSCGDTLDVLPKAGGAPAALVGTAGGSVLVLDDQYAYFGDLDNIKRVPLAGGAATQLTKVEEELTSGLADQLAIDSTKLYSSNGTSLLAMPKDGSAPFETIAPSEIGARIIVDTDAIYWAMVSAIHRMAKTEGSTDQTLVVLDRPDNFLYEPLGLTATTLYYIDNQLYAIPKTGGAPVVVDPHAGGQPGLATDSNYAYWAQTNTLVRGTETGTIEPLAFSPDGIEGIAVDASSVYWADGGGQLLRQEL
jgi:hypothetical protein